MSFHAWMTCYEVNTFLQLLLLLCACALLMPIDLHETPLAIPTVISDAAIKAAINLVDVCIQHAAFLAGRGDVEETV